MIVFLWLHLFLTGLRLISLVPSPGPMDANAPPFIPSGTMGDVRVVRDSSLPDESADPSFTPQKCFSMKPSEVWGRGGYGLVVSRPRIVQIKRSYKRACFRALQHGYAPYRKGYLFATDVPWRLREAYRRLSHEKMKQRTPQTTPGIRCMTWNASKNLVHDELLHWCNSQPLDIIALQEIGWNFNSTWTSQGWHCIHSSTKHATSLVLIRNTLARPEQIATASHSDGRLLQIRLFLDCTYNFIVVYQHAWKATKGRDQLLDNRAKIWTSLQQFLNHVPQQHQMVLMGDFNTTLKFDPPHINSHDARASTSTHIDRDLLQQLTRAQDLIAVHCKQQHASTFEYGSHHSRIDYVFIRQHQVQIRRMQPTINRNFMRNFGCLGPHHPPLFFVLPRWFAPRKPVFPLNNIDRFALRTARLEHTPHWQLFEVQIRQRIARHSPQQPNEVSMLALEQELRTICFLFFPKRKQRVPHAPHIPSLATRMWNARKQAMAVRGRITRDLFECWAATISLLQS